MRYVRRAYPTHYNNMYIIVLLYTDTNNNVINTIHTLVVSICACVYIVYTVVAVSIRNYDIKLNGCKNILCYIRRYMCMVGPYHI